MERRMLCKILSCDIYKINFNYLNILQLQGKTDIDVHNTDGKKSHYNIMNIIFKRKPAKKPYFIGSFTSIRVRQILFVY